MKKTDTLLAILGIVLTIIVFLVQGPYTSTWNWKYLVVALPILLTVIAILANRLFEMLKSERLTFRELMEERDAIMGAEITSELVVRILNTEGDASYERKFRYDMVKNTTIRRTKRDLIGSEVKLNGMPPPARVLGCSNQNMTLTPKEVCADEIIRSGRKHFDYRWYYELSPPLSGKGKFIEYEYESNAPGSEKSAFSEEGGIFFFHHEVILMEMRCVLISPPTHRIQIIDFRVTDSDGNSVNVPSNERPATEANGHMLSWRPAYVKATSVCRYKLVPL